MVLFCFISEFLFSDAMKAIFFTHILVALQGSGIHEFPNYT